MKLLIDENVPLKLAKSIMHKYKDSAYVLTSELKGKSDRRIYFFAKKNKFTILTFDTDFLDINTYPLKGSSRIVLRFKQIKIKELTNFTLNALEKLEGKNLENSLIIIDKNRIRIKRLGK